MHKFAWLFTDPLMLATACFLTVHYFLYFFAEPYFCFSQTRKKEPRLYLADEGEEGLTNWTTQIFEYLVLARYSFFGYKNSVRSNLRIFSAALMTCFAFLGVSIVLRFFGLHISLFETKSGVIALNTTVFASVLGFFVSTFVLERTHLHKKWEFLSNMLNKRNELDLGVKRDVFETGLVLNMIEMEMWSHRSYRDLFKSVLARAYSSNKGEYPFKTKSFKYAEEEILKQSQAGELLKSAAYEMVELYQKQLMQNQKFEAIKKAA